MKNAAVAVAIVLIAAPLLAQAPERRPAAPPAPTAEQPPARTPAEGDAPAEKASTDRAADRDKTAPARDQIWTTRHTVVVGGESIAYTARSGFMILKDDQDGTTPRASIFFTSYTRDGVDPSRRPITFTFNGGPGSSSVWLHMGAFGPKRVAYADAEGREGAPPYKVVDNESSLLDLTDMVFIDPVTTGFSRAIPFKDANKFHGVDADIESVGQFIRMWTTRYARWASPKFLAGESYGTTRAAGLSGWLTRQGYYLNGIVLLSSILNFETTSFDSANDLGYELFLPTYTAVAWYHHKLSPDLQNGTIENAVAMSEKYALGPYTAALMQGDRISDEERRNVAAHLANLTGLSRDYIERANLRISLGRFDKELLRDQRKTVGRLDGRFTGVDRDAAGDNDEFDPSMASIMGEYTAIINDYVRRELKVETDLAYEILTDKVRPWSYERSQNRYVDVAETLRNAIAQNPALKVFVANGYYDGATPFAATNYTFARMQLEPALRKNVSMDYFEGGHMMYIDRRAHAKLKKDLVEFYGRAANVK
jgi:carboxypeptidase C (cathepsin A)